MKNKFSIAMTLAVVLAILVTSLALAYVSTDQADYSPGSTVTIFGDNSDGAGFLGGETVHVDVSGPNGYAASCEAKANDAGAWSCQVTLWDSELAVGDYAYTATGQTSSFSQSGTFTDASTTENVNFATSGLPDGTSVSVTYSGTNPGGNPQNGTANFNDPGPSSPSIGFKGSTLLQCTFPTSIIVGSSTYNLSSQPCGASGTMLPAASNPTHTTTFTGMYEVVASNSAPTVAAANASVTVNEGQTATNTGTWSDANAGDTVTLSASVGTVIKSGTNAAGTWSWSFGTTDGPDQNQTVTITANDGNGGSSSTTFALAVNNVAPTATLNGDASANEGETKTYSFTVNDPGADTYTGAASCGTGGNLVGGSYNITGNSGSQTGSFQCSFPEGPATPTVSIQFTDSDSAAGNTASVDVTVNNVAPTVVLSGDDSANEGQTKSYSYTVTDTGQDTPTASTSCGLNGTKSNETSLSGSLTSSGYSGSGSYDCTFPDGLASSDVSVTADDGDLLNNIGSDTITVDIANVAPTITDFTLTVPSGFACQGANNSVTVSFSVSDPADEAHDPINGTITWGDISPTTAISGRTISQSHNYSAGVWSLTVSVNDGDGGIANAGGTNNVSILYYMSAILPPVNPDGTSVFNAKSTIPVKVVISDCNGLPVPGLAPQIGTSLSSSLAPSAPVNETISTSAADTTGVMRYDPTSGQYIYNWNAKASGITDFDAKYYFYVRGKDTNGNIVTNPSQVSSKFGLKSK